MVKKHFFLLIKTGGLLFLITLVTLSGCTKQRTGGTISVGTPNFFGIGEDLARQLDDNRKGSKEKNKKLILTTVVPLEKLSETSNFGRALTEALATRLFQHGFGVVEIRKTSELLIRNDSGELVLSREAALLAGQHEADAIVAGTYSLTPRTVILNLRMLSASSQEVLSVAGLEIQRSHTINSLLSDGKGVSDAELSVYERYGG